jgi:transcriptional regulator with XRE-family HTH domain
MLTEMLIGPGFMDRLAKRLKEARLRAGLSQAELATLIGVSRGAVGQWESNKAEPSNANMRAASDALKVSVDWLANNRGEMSQAPIVPAMSADGELVESSKLPPDQAKVINAARSGKATEVWRITSSMMAGAGFRPGDLVVVDTTIQARAQHFVLAESNHVPIFRQWIPPYLFCLSLSPQPGPLQVDNITTILRGTVISRFSF